VSALAVRDGGAGQGVDPLLIGDLLAHLDVQVASAARVLEIVLAQSAAIRARDVDAVVRHVAELQAELERRTRLEQDRARLLGRAAGVLGIAIGDVTLSRIAERLPQHEASVARTRSAELNGLLTEIGREHACNQALMRQELAFLDHLLRLIDPVPALGYASGGTRRTMPPAGTAARHTLDLQA
jgi:FlgN protein